MSYFSSPFPQEIIDSVVEELSSDRDSLKQCALVSRCQFLQPARRHLFSDIKLHKPLHCQRLLTVLKSNPEITRYIRHLILSNLRLGLLVHSEEVTVATILTLIQSLRSLSLSYLFWDTLPIELRSTLYALFRSPSLKKLSFIGVHDFPLEDLSSFTQLESLYLSAMDGMRQRSYPETPPFENPKEIRGQLKSLEIGMGSIRSAKSILTVLGHPTSKLSYSQLTELSIEVVNPETLDIYQSLMKAAGSSLKSFSSKLDFSRWPAPVEINCMPHLESFHLQVGCFCKSAEDPLSWLILALKSYTGAKGLRNLSIRLDRCWGWGSIQLCVRERQLQGKLTSPVWPSLDALLAGDQFANLQSVTMVISGSVNPKLRSLSWNKEDAKGPPETDYFSEVPRRMPLLRDRGILSVERVKEPEDHTLDFYL